MIYTVTLNPAIDYITAVENYKIGRVNRSSAECIEPGGKGINVSIVLKNLGIESVALGFCGGHTGRMLIELLKEKNCNCDFISVPNGSTRINVKLQAENEETEINGCGPLIDENCMNEFFDRLDKLNENDFLILGGSVPNGIPKNIYSLIIERMNKINVRTVVDASGQLLSNAVQMHPFLVKPNNFELSELFGTEVKTRRDAMIYGKRLQAMGARNVLISMAGDGAVLVCENGEHYEMDAPKGIVKNSVGAGDSMVAGFVAGLVRYGEFPSAFKMGISSGSASAFSDHLASYDEVMSIFKSLK